MCLLRANYDAYVRRRLIRETGLESEANRIWPRAGTPRDRDDRRDEGAEPRCRSAREPRLA